MHIGQGCKVEEKVRWGTSWLSDRSFLVLDHLKACHRAPFFSGAHLKLHHYGQCDGGNGLCASGSPFCFQIIQLHTYFKMSLFFIQYWHFIQDCIICDGSNVSGNVKSCIVGRGQEVLDFSINLATLFIELY